MKSVPKKWSGSLCTILELIIRRGIDSENYFSLGKDVPNNERETPRKYRCNDICLGVLPYRNDIWILVWGAREGMQAVSLMGAQPSGNRHDSVVYPLATDPDRVSATPPLASRNKIPLLFSLTTRHFPSKYFVHMPK